MEVMDTSLDKFYKFIYDSLHCMIPENILGKITVAVSEIDIVLCYLLSLLINENFLPVDCESIKLFERKLKDYT